MGQYFLVVNTTKREFLHPHKFGDGFKLMEFGCSSLGTMTALALLLRQSSETGGGDWTPEHYGGENELVGSWVGDSLVIVGDYDESGLFDTALNDYRDISSRIFDAFKVERVEDEKIQA